MRSRALLAIVAALGCGDEARPPAAEDVVLTAVPGVAEPAYRASAEVDPFIGSGGVGYAFGSAFPGAAAPNGLVKVGPDTSGELGTVGFQHFSGYWYEDDAIQGFSHVHLHGTGATDGGVISLMPIEALVPGATTVEEYESPFAKQSEQAAPGRYAVTLERGGIRVELAAAPHAALHRYTFARDAAAGTVLVDLAHHLSGGEIGSTELVLDPDGRRFRGRLRNLGAMSARFGGFDVFFEGETSIAWSSAKVWHDGGAPEEVAAAEGLGIGAALAFDLDGPVLVRIGLSLVSAEGAAANLDGEVPDFDWERTAAAASDAWEQKLGRVRLTGGTPAERRTFYTSLYHAYLMPTLVSDLDGRWRGPDDAVRTSPAGRQLSDFSLWDTYRTVHPLYDLVDHDAAADSVRSLHEFAKVSGYFPKWPLATGETGTMIGASAESVVADAQVKGVPGIDAAGAYAILRAAAADLEEPPGGRGGRGDVVDYIQVGWVPADATSGSVSRTTEYAQGDFALSALAASLGETADAEAFLERSQGYRELFDDATGFLRGRNADGSFALADFDPLEPSRDYVEANAWQSVFAVPHDVEGLATAFGGNDALVARLSELFEHAREELAAIDPDDTLTRALQRPYYWHGNEPDIHAAYLFARVGRPDLTQEWVRWIEDSLYSDRPDGLAGNDDGGTLGAWYVFSALGLYPIAGADFYVLGAPRFPRAEVTLPSGATLVVEAEGAAPDAIYVQEASFDGAALDRAELAHDVLAAGGTLRFVLGPTPSSWGQR